MMREFPLPFNCENVLKDNIELEIAFINVGIHGKGTQERL